MLCRMVCLGTECFCSQAAANEAQASNCSATWFSLCSLPLKAMGLTSLQKARIPSAHSLELEASQAVSGLSGRTLGLPAMLEGYPYSGEGPQAQDGGDDVTLCCSTVFHSPVKPCQLLGAPARNTGLKAMCREDFCNRDRPPCPVP